MTRDSGSMIITITTRITDMISIQDNDEIYGISHDPPQRDWPGPRDCAAACAVLLSLAARQRLATKAFDSDLDFLRVKVTVTTGMTAAGPGSAYHCLPVSHCGCPGQAGPPHSDRDAPGAAR